MDSPECSDSTVSFGPVAGEERWSPSDRVRTTVWAAMCVPLMIPQVLWWPVTGGTRTSSWLVTLTLLSSTLPLIAYQWLRQDSVYSRWAAAHGFRFDAKPTWSLPNFGIAPFNTVEASDFTVTDALDGEVNGCAALYFNLSGSDRPEGYDQVFALQMSGRLPHMTLAAKPAADRTDGVGYAVSEQIRPFYRYGDPDTVRVVFNTSVIDVVLAGLPKRVSEDIRFDTAGEFLIAVTQQGFRAEQITAVFLTMYALTTAVRPTDWIPD